MSLYLCIFDGRREVMGVEVGPYSDFGDMRDLICERLEGGRNGSRFPVFMLHSDCDGLWSPDEAARLATELQQIEAELAALPAMPLAGWKASVAKRLGKRVTSLAECFFDVDGEPLFDQLVRLCERSIELSLPILFQ